MQGYHFFYVGKPQAESFCFVQISFGDPLEFFENMGLIAAFYADAIISKQQVVALGIWLDPNTQFRFIIVIFQGVIDKVT